MITAVVIVATMGFVETQPDLDLSTHPIATNPDTYAMIRI